MKLQVASSTFDVLDKVMIDSDSVAASASNAARDAYSYLLKEAELSPQGYSLWWTIIYPNTRIDLSI